MIETPFEIPRGSQVDLEDGRTIAYHEAGTGPAVIFVHGSGPGGSGWSNFQGNYKALAQAGCRALVPDLLGYGYSSKPEDAQYTLDYLTQGVLDFAGGTVVHINAGVAGLVAAIMLVALSNRSTLDVSVPVVQDGCSPLSV